MTETAPTGAAARRITSVLFGDLVGFTTLSESRDPEEVRELLTAYFDECRAVVSRYGGELEKFIGDAVMAVWGLPVTREDDAERAVRAGLELVERVTALGDRIAMPGLAMRVGITTAEVAVTLGATGQGMVAGDAVNTAARIQSTAPPGEVWVDETTRSFTSTSIAYDDAGAHEMKGKAEPVALWAVRAVVAGAGGDRRDDGLEGALIGRDRELRLIKEIFHRVEETMRPGLLVVDGEPGVGKSRLGWEFEKYVDGFDAGVLWHRGRCLSYGEGVAYYALAEAVRTRLGILAGDAEAEDQGALLKGGLAACVADVDERAWLEPRLAALLGLDPGGSFPREDLFVAWTAFLKYVGRGESGAPEPVILVVDDAQHADDGLLAFLEHLLAAADFSVFVLVLARPEFLGGHAEFVGNRRVSVVHLEPLSADEMDSVVAGLVDGVPARLRAELVARAEGIPLYAIETVRSLIDQDFVVPRGGRYVLDDAESVDLAEITAPATLQALIAARLDILPAAERRVVDRASVLGLVFTNDGIATLCADLPQLEQALAGLVRREVLRRETDRFSVDRGGYKFVQGAVRQVAYGMLSRRDRKATHLSVARAFETELATRSDAYELTPIIAQHYLDAIDAVPGDPDIPELTRAASDHLERAADRAAALGAPHEATGHLKKALERCEPDRRMVIEGRLARQLRIAGELAAAIEHATAAIEAFDAAGDLLGAATATEDLALALCYSEGDLSRAEKVVSEHLDLLPDEPEFLLSRVALVGALASVAMRNGNQEGLARTAQEAMRLAELSGDPRLIADGWIIYAISCTGALPLLATTLFERAAALAGEHRAHREHALALINLCGLASYADIPGGIRYGREAIEAAREIGENFMAAFGESNLSHTLLLAGDWDEAVALAGDEDVRAYTTVTTDILLRFVAMVRDESMPSVTEQLEQDPATMEDQAWLAEYDLDRALEAHVHGLPEAAQLACAAVARSRDTGGSAADLWPVWMFAAELVRDLDDVAVIREMLAFVDDRLGPWPEAVRTQRALLQAVVGAAGSWSPDQVEQTFCEAIELARSWGSRLYEAHAQAGLGRWLASQARADEGAVLVAHAREVYEQIGARRWLAALDRTTSAAG